MNIKTIEVRKKQKKKQPFDNSYSITYRKPNYDALGDPHASYYFLNRSMRKHLLSLKKSIQREGSFVEKKNIRYMIGQRIRDYDNDSRKTKVDAYYFNMKSSPSISSLASIRSHKSIVNEQAQSNNKNRVQNQLQEKSKTLELELLENKQKKKKPLQLPVIAQKKAEQTKGNSNKDEIKSNSNKDESKVNNFNKTEHNKFLQFLMEKKKRLSIQKNITSSKQEDENSQTINN